MDALIRSQLRARGLEPSAQMARDLFVLRLFCRPVTVCTWRAGRGAEGSVSEMVERLSDWDYGGFQVTGRVQRVIRKTWVLFPCPTSYLPLLLPDLFARTRCPIAEFQVPRADEVRRKVRYSLDRDVDDWARTGDERHMDEVLADWGDGPLGYAWTRPRLSDDAVSVLSLNPVEVRRFCVMMGPEHEELEDYEVRALRAIAGVPVSLMGRDSGHQRCQD